jgi:hypothetical protein
MKNPNSDSGSRLPRTVVLVSALLMIISLAGCNETEPGIGGNLKVAKSDLSLQCQPDSGIPLEEMQMELVNAGIDVLCAQTGSDGRAYVSVCGAPTGRANIYEIRASNLQDAEALGFVWVGTLDGYVDEICE